MTGDLPDQCRAAAGAAFVLDTNYPKCLQLKVHLTLNLATQTYYLTKMVDPFAFVLDYSPDYLFYRVASNRNYWTWRWVYYSTVWLITLQWSLAEYITVYLLYSVWDQTAVIRCGSCRPGTLHTVKSTYNTQQPPLPYTLNTASFTVNTV